MLLPVAYVLSYLHLSIAFREEYALLKEIGATRKEAVLDTYFSRPEAWKALIPKYMMDDQPRSRGESSRTDLA